MNNAIQKHDPQHLVNLDDYDSLVEATIASVADSSKRVYMRVFDAWSDYCHNRRISPLDMRPKNVTRFLESMAVTRTTRKRQLSAMRSLARMYSIADPIDGVRIYQALKATRITQANITENERSRHALTPEQAHKVLSVWDGDKLLDLRNRAMVAVLFLTGVRRSEVAAMKWEHINFDQETIFIPHGKGDKERDVTIAGGLAMRALQAWHKALPKRVYVFPSFDRGQKPGEDSPTDGQTVYRVVKRTEKVSGVKFSPHTARRTFITEALMQGAPLADVQAQAGHADSSTTLRYARPVDASERKRHFKHRYGD